MTALGGVVDALAEVGAAGALRSSLAAGLPEELAWPALESVYAEFAAEAAEEEERPTRRTRRRKRGRGPGRLRPGSGRSGRSDLHLAGPHGVRERPGGRRRPGRSARLLPVHGPRSRHPAHRPLRGRLVPGELDLAPRPRHCDTAVWADRPDEPFTPDETRGLVPFHGSLDGEYGFQFETADGGGRHGGLRALRPGGTEGIDGEELQLGDGSRIWTNDIYSRRPWEVVDPVTGERRGPAPCRTSSDAPRTRPRTPSPTRPRHRPGRRVVRGGDEHGHRGPPPGAASRRSRRFPAGQQGRSRRHPDPVPHPAPRLRARPLPGREHRRPRRPLRHRPAGTEAVGAVGTAGGRGRGRGPRRGRDPDGRARVHRRRRPAVGAGRPPLARTPLDEAGPPGHPSGGVALPPAFWYLLRTRDTAGSRALRTVTRPTADALLTAALDGTRELRAAVARELPDVTDPVLVAAVVAVARRAAGVESAAAPCTGASPSSPRHRRCRRAGPRPTPSSSPPSSVSSRTGPATGGGAPRTPPCRRR